MKTRRDAALAFGHVESQKESVRDPRAGQWLAQTLHDVRYALRLLVKWPTVSEVVIGTIAHAVFGSANILTSFDAAHLRSPELRTLLAKIEVVANDEFTRAYEKLPVEHHTRVNVVTRGGERIVGEAGGDKGDLAQPKSDAQIAEKFLGVTEEFLGAGRAKAVLERLWKLEKLDNVAQIPNDFVKKVR